MASATSRKRARSPVAAINLTALIQQIVGVLIVIAGTYEFSEGRLAMGAIVATVMLASRAGALDEAQQAVGRPLTILGDAATPYGLLRQLMAICAATEYRDLSLAVEVLAPAKPEAL